MSNITELYAQFKIESTQESEHERVLIVDSLNAYIRCFASTPTLNDDGEHFGGVTGFLKSIGLAIRTYKPTRVICVFDGKGGSQRRRKMLPTYKDNRKTMTRLNRTYEYDSIEAEKQSMKYQLITLVEMLTHLPVQVFAIDNVEADDVIAYTSNLLESRGKHVIIMSTDKDFLQLVSDQVKVYNPVKKKLYDVALVQEEFQIHPRNFAIFRALDGDKSDNVKGIKGAGLKTLVKYFPSLLNEQKYTVDQFLAEAEPQKNALCKKILAEKETVSLNYDLMRLDEVNISGATKLDIVQFLDNWAPSINKMELTKLLHRDKLMGAFNDFSMWTTTTFVPLLKFNNVK